MNVCVSHVSLWGSVYIHLCVYRGVSVFSQIFTGLFKNSVCVSASHPSKEAKSGALIHTPECSTETDDLRTAL